MSDTRRLSNIKWIATGVDGHTHHTCGEWMYTCDAPPVEADEYERMKARAETAEAKLAALTFEPDWSKAPRLAKWWAVDEDGTAHWYWTEPTMGKHGWFVRGSSTHLVGTSQLAGHIELIGRDWWDTLRCKPGSTA